MPAAAFGSCFGGVVLTGRPFASCGHCIECSRSNAYEEAINDARLAKKQALRNSALGIRQDDRASYPYVRFVDYWFEKIAASCHAFSLQSLNDVHLRCCDAEQACRGLQLQRWREGRPTVTLLGPLGAVETEARRPHHHAHLPLFVILLSACIASERFAVCS